uniref:Uncharacterized protein n=1 Tax=Romanomermis culicivorax TaxID=13658 RepID=A0A915K207_ROMCU
MTLCFFDKDWVFMASRFQLQDWQIFMEEVATWPMISTAGSYGGRPNYVLTLLVIKFSKRIYRISEHSFHVTSRRKNDKNVEYNSVDRLMKIITGIRSEKQDEHAKFCIADQHPKNGEYLNFPAKNYIEKYTFYHVMTAQI